MAYKTRCTSRTDIYHVMIRGINHEKIFGKRYYKHVMKGIMYKKKEGKDIDIFAYCIMDNHMHLLIKAKLDDLSLYMSRIQNAYAKFYNKSLERYGHVFQNRFKSECVEDEKYFYCCMKYIHKNPVKASICTNESDYEFSSLYEIQNKKYFLLNEDLVNKLECDHAVNYTENEYMFKDIPPEMAQQKLFILKELIYRLIKENHLHSIYQIFEMASLYNKLLEDYKKITKTGIKCANDSIIQYLLKLDSA